MTANTNTVLRQVTLPYLQYSVLDDLIALSGAINTQAGAHPVRSECVRITAAPANASMIMREGDAGSSSPWTFIVNDSGQAIVVFAAVGENMDGVLNGSRSIAAAQSAYFMRIPRSSGAAIPDWRSGTIS